MFICKYQVLLNIQDCHEAASPWQDCHLMETQQSSEDRTIQEQRAKECS